MFLSLLANRRRLASRRITGRSRTTRRRRQPIRLNKDASPVDIPEELIELILSKCPAKSVVRFKSVSKSWRSTIYSRRFSRIHHMERSKLPENQSKFLFYTDPKNSYNHRLYMMRLRDGKWRREAWPGDLPVKFSWPVCSCDGLILLRKRAGGDYVFWNPFIGKHIIIAKPECKSKPYVYVPWNCNHDHLYYDPVSEDYKIVYVFEDWYAVYSCKNGSWGETKDFPRDRMPKSASVDGCIYGMQRRGDGGISIMCFDFGEGKLHELMLPEGADCLHCVGLKEVSGRLCWYGFNKDGGGLQLWVMERNNNDYNYCRSWRKLISMDNRGSLSYILQQNCPIGLSNEDDVVLWSNGEHFIYHSRRKSLRKANFPWKISHHYCPYQENLYLMP